MITRRFFTLAALSIVVAWVPQAATCDDSRGEGDLTPSSAVNQALQFRRVYVPQGRPDEWPSVSDAHVPVGKEEFQRLVQIAQSATAGATPFRAARITRARYRAELVGEVLLVGTAELQVTHQGLKPALVRLSPCDLPVHRAIWQESEKLAVVGNIRSSDYAALVEASGVLQLDWSIEEAANDRGTAFELRLPECVDTAFEITAPSTFQITTSDGLATRETRNAADTQTWILRNKGGRVRFQIIDTDTDVRADDRPLVREQTTFDISPGGVDVATTLEVDMPGTSSRLDLEADQGLIPRAAFVGDRELNFSIAPSVVDGGKSIWTLELPEDLIEDGLKLTVFAVTQPEMSKSWQLPRVRLRTARWQSGTMTVRIHDPLQIETLELRDCHQTSKTTLPGMDRGEVLSFRMHHPGAEVMVQLGKRADTLGVRRATSIELKPAESSGQVTAELRTNAAEQYSVEMTALNPWTIDSITSVPMGAVEDWSITNAVEGGQRVLVRLRVPIRADQSMRLLITGRNSNSAIDAQIDGQTIEMVRFDSAVRERSLVAVNADERYALDVRNIDLLNLVGQNSLSAEERSLLRESNGALIFEGTTSRSVLISLKAGEPTFAAKLTVELSVLDDSVQQKFSIACLPDGDLIEQLVVRFATRNETPIAWQLAGETVPLRAARLSAEEAAELGLPTSGESWRIWLPRPTTDGFELEGERLVSSNEGVQVPLIHLAGAREQTGELTISADDGVPLEIDNRSLVPLPRAFDTPGRAEYVARFAFDPETDIGNADDTAISVSRRRDARTGLIVWQQLVQSQVGSNRQFQHTVDLWLENNGSSHLTFDWPSDARLLSLHINGRFVADRLQSSDRNILKVPISPEDRFSVVSIGYRTMRRPGTTIQRVPLPEIRSPAASTPLNREWTVWTPPGIAVRVDDGWQAIGTRSFDFEERLLSLFGYRRHRVDVDLFSSDDWRRQFARLASPTPATEVALSALDRLVTEIARDRRNPNIGWRRLLVEWDAYLGRHGLQLFVDPEIMRSVGITPESPAELFRSSSDDVSGRALLGAAELDVVVSGSAVLFQHSRRSARGDSGLQPSRAGKDTTELLSLHPVSFQRGAAPPLLRPQVWGTIQTSRTPGVFRLSDGFDLGGWRAWRFVGGSAEPALHTFLVSRSGWYGWLTFLVAVLIAWRLGRARSWLPCWLAISAAVATLWSSAAYAPITSGTFWGCVLGAAIAWFGQIRATTNETNRKHRGNKSKPVEIALLTFLLVMGNATVGFGQEPTPPAESPYRVLIPVDEAKHPVGDHYYVPVPLLDELRSTDAEIRGEPRNWLLQQARYSLRLPSDSVIATSIELVARFDMRFFGPSLPCRLTLGMQGLAGVPGVDSQGPQSVRLDGEKITAAWSNETGRLEFNVLQAGLHQLEIRWPLRVQSNDDEYSVTANIPTANHARLHVTVPDDATRVRVPSAHGPINSNGGTRLVQTEIGPSSLLDVHWTDAAQTPMVADVEELYWLHIKPGNVRLDAHYRFPNSAPPDGIVEVVLGPDVRVLPSDDSDNGNTVVSSQSDASGRQIVRFDIEGDQDLENGIQFSMTLTKASGIGHIRFPDIRLQNGQSTKRWLAVDVDSALKHAWSPTANPLLLDVDEFLSAWGNRSTRPTDAMQLPPRGADWYIATAPIEGKKTARQQISLNAAEHELNVRYIARINQQAGSVFHYDIEAPPDLTIQRVTVTEGQKVRSTRWSQNESGQLTVFLPTETNNPQQVEIQGTLPYSNAENRRVDAPSFSVRDAELEGTEIAISHRYSVVAEMLETQGLNEIAGEPGSWTQWPESHLIAKLTGDSGEYAATFSVAANSPRGDARMVTFLERVGQSWNARVDVQLNVAAGQYHALRFDVPTSWTGPYILEPQCDFRAVPLPGQTQMRLIVRPRQPMVDDYRLTIRGPVVTTPGQRVRLPAIRLREIDNIEQYVVLPSQDGLSPLTWDTQGLRPLDSAADTDDLLPEIRGGHAFEVVGESYWAALRSSDDPRGDPQVWLADVRLAWPDGNRVYGVAVFDLDPGGAKRCPLTMPRGLELIQVRINGRRAVTSQRDNGAWLVNLDSARLPQSIEVVFEGRVELAEEIRFAGPRLGKLPVERTLWTLRTPNGIAHLDSEYESISPATRERLALNSVAELVMHGTDDAASTPAARDLWFAGWLSRLADSRFRLERFLTTIGDPELSIVRSDLEAVDEEYDRIASEMNPPSREFARRQTSAIDLWHAQSLLCGAEMCFQFRGRQTELSFAASPLVTRRRLPAGTSASPMAMIWTGSLILLGAALSLRGVRGLLRRWPEAWLVVAAVAMWIAVLPDAIGAILMAGILMISFATRWNAANRFTQYRNASRRPAAG